MKRARRATELIAEAILLARTREPRAHITWLQQQASTEEVRNWARRACSEAGTDGSIPDHTDRHIPTADTELNPYPSTKYHDVPPGGKGIRATPPIHLILSKVSR